MEALQLQEYDEWLVEHLDELVTKYPAKVVAIYEGKIVSIGDTETDVYRRVREADLESMPLVFRVSREEDLQSITSASLRLELRPRAQSSRGGRGQFKEVANDRVSRDL